MCPYFDSEYNRCVFLDTYQDGYHKAHIEYSVRGRR